MSKEPNYDRETRMHFMRIDGESIEHLKEFWKVVEPALPKILDGFYAHVTTTPKLAKLVGDQTPRLKRAQGTHWQRLFTSGFDTSYFESVRTIGLTHNRIGLEPRWYIGGYNFVMGMLMDLAVKTYRWKPAKLSAVLRAVTAAVNLDMDNAISTYQDAMLEERQQRQNGLDAAIREFNAEIASALTLFGTTSEKMQETATALTRTASVASQQSNNVATAAEQASANVQTVAASAEELSASIGEISRQVAESASITKKAVEEAGRTNQQILGLADSAQKIGDVVKLINSIAGQTNLLALNATIEAARAGEAGKGFAVVASEVKSLANQTGKATEEISSKITEIQAATSSAVQAIRKISETINRINEIATNIASAVEEQGAATTEIARNVQEASRGTADVSTNIGGVTKAATETGASADIVLKSAENMSNQASSLRAEVDRFFARVKAA